MAAVLVILAYTGGGQSREYYFGSVSRDSGPAMAVLPGMLTVVAGMLAVALVAVRG